MTGDRRPCTRSRSSGPWRGRGCGGRDCGCDDGGGSRRQGGRSGGRRASRGDEGDLDTRTSSRCRCRCRCRCRSHRGCHCRRNSSNTGNSSSTGSSFPGCDGHHQRRGENRSPLFYPPSRGEGENATVPCPERKEQSEFERSDRLDPRRWNIRSGCCCDHYHHRHHHRHHNLLPPPPHRFPLRSCGSRGRSTTDPPCLRRCIDALGRRSWRSTTSRRRRG
mmetsp:Transcript_34592/g.62303  ORF Transcript_34592/g.62303 Transcript_34592/m.62303 type:complete len:220 (+) Transcript_34592:1435-2094(+)